jgi:uncharacterized protein YcgL (UPF0745 family)
MSDRAENPGSSHQPIWHAARLERTLHPGAPLPVLVAVADECLVAECTHRLRISEKAIATESYTVRAQGHERAIMPLCTVFRSGKRAETYLYLAQGQPFEDLPPELRAAFGEPCFVMALNLSEERQLARVDTRQVLEHLETRGFYLQLPPETPVEEQISQRFSGKGNKRRK